MCYCSTYVNWLLCVHCIPFNKQNARCTGFYANMVLFHFIHVCMITGFLLLSKANTLLNAKFVKPLNSNRWKPQPVDSNYWAHQCFLISNSPVSIKVDHCKHKLIYSNMQFVTVGLTLCSDSARHHFLYLLTHLAR